MRRFSKRLRLLTFALGLFTLTGLVAAASVFTDLGVSENDARAAMFDNLTGSGSYFPGNKAAFKSASGQARAAMVQALATFGKAYVQSDTFKQKYAAYLEANRPTPPTPKTVDGEVARIKKDIEDGIKNTEETIKQMPPDQQKQMQDLIASMREQEAQYDDPATKQMLATSIAQENLDDKQQYEENLKEFNDDHPTDVNVLVARRLEEFVDLSQTVNFDAKLDANGSFVDQKYERQDGNWKLLYRAGKPAVDAARAFAQQWLKELKAAP